MKHLINEPIVCKVYNGTASIVFRTLSDIWDKVFKNGPSEIRGREAWSILEYFVHKKGPLQMLDKVLNTPLIYLVIN